MKKNKVLFVIPDGVGIKNYLFSNLLKDLLLNKSEIFLLHNLPSIAIKEVEIIHKTKFQELKLIPYRENLVLRFLRESTTYARLIYNSRITNNSTILTNWNRPKMGKKYWFFTLTELIGKLISINYKIIIAFEILYNKLLSLNINPYLAIFKNLNPDVIFNTHQRSYLSILPLQAAKKLNIRNMGAIFSWDNLPKARLTAKSEEYVVWSEYMKQEMRLYYPEIKPENIHITGTPQFEYYYDASLLWSREDFCSRHDVDPAKKIIVYSGGDLTTSPYDQFYLDELAKQIIQSTLKNEIQILVRPAPVDHTNRYDEIVHKYPYLVKYSKPLWSQGADWTQTFPTFEDILLQVNTVFHSETVINVGSSMAFDYATMKKPAIYINFNILEDQKWNIFTINAFQHFKSMEGLHPVFWWNKPDEIAKLLEQIFTQNYALDNVEWFEKINNTPKNASENIVKLIT